MNSIPITQLILVGSLFSAAFTAFAAEAPAPQPPTKIPDRMAWFTDARFGMFIHWGPVSLKGTEIGWSRGGERRGRKDKKTGDVPVEEYDNLYHQFNPTNFNARQWVSIAKDAGMKYLVFTTRHHDGFSMFDSQVSDYKITLSPFGRDVVKELADACHRAHLRLGFYYSPPDWHHPDYRTNTHSRFVEYMHTQVRELSTRYGPVDIFWWDGLGGKAEDWDTTNLFQMIRQSQPRVLLNNRAGVPADFDTPEQKIGKFQNTRPWESCITICHQWAWKPDDKLKSLDQCIHTLVSCAGGDGNLLLNVGPMPDGRIEPRQVERLREMGVWLKHYGESIYGTRGGPFKPGSWGVSTCKGKYVYLHVFKWPADGLRLPLSGKPVKAAKVLTGGKATITQTADGITITVPEKCRQPIDTVIRLKLDSSAVEMLPVALPDDEKGEHSTAAAADK
jgi:alpha-L-fucosidase